MRIKDLPILPLSTDFLALLQKELDNSNAELEEHYEIIFNFRDPEYSAENGGFRPVEIMISHDGEIRYITEFTYVGTAPFYDLAKSIDVEPQHGVFSVGDMTVSKEEFAEFFALWQRNFVCYHEMGVYRVSVSN